MLLEDRGNTLVHLSGVDTGVLLTRLISDPDQKCSTLRSDTIDCSTTWRHAGVLREWYVSRLAILTRQRRIACSCSAVRVTARTRSLTTVCACQQRVVHGALVSSIKQADHKLLMQL